MTVVRSIAVLSGLLLFACAGTAQAGFMPVQMDDHATPAAGTTNTAPAHPDHQPAPPSVHDHDFATQSSSNGVSGSSVTTSGGNAPPAILGDNVNVSARLIALLGPEGRVWLPPPFSTGVFRPPRG